VPSKLEEIPFVGKFFVPRPFQPTPEALANKARSLKYSIRVEADMDRRRAGLAVLAATDSHQQHARLLALTGANLLLDVYYDQLVSRAETIAKGLSVLLENDQVKDMIERAVNVARQGEKAESPKASKEEAINLRLRQKEVSERIKELDLRLQTDRERRLAIEHQIAELQQRYGPFHPSIKALQQQITTLGSTSKQREISSDMSRLQDRLIAYEAEAAAMGLTDTVSDSEAVDKVVQRLTNRLNRYQLELIRLKHQQRNPEQRVRLSMSEATMPTGPVSSKRRKMALILAGLGLGLILATVLAREVLGGRARDAWTASWILKRPCHASLVRADQAASPLDLELIRSMRGKLLDARPASRRDKFFVKLRRFAHWLHHEPGGGVLLLVKSGDHPRCSRVLHNIINVYGCDYSKKVLVVDFDGRDPIEANALGSGPTVVDFLVGRAPWKVARLARDGRRGYDLLRAPAPAGEHLTEILASKKLGELVQAATRLYDRVILVGLGPGQFVENGLLLSQASSYLIVVESPKTTFRHLSQLVAYLGRDKLRGHVHVES
jgi:hypothetical protein